MDSRAGRLGWSDGFFGAGGIWVNGGRARELLQSLPGAGGDFFAQCCYLLVFGELTLGLSYRGWLNVVHTALN